MTNSSINYGVISSTGPTSFVAGTKITPDECTGELLNFGRLQFDGKEVSLN